MKIEIEVSDGKAIVLAQALEQHHGDEWLYDIADAIRSAHHNGTAAAVTVP